jgi:hypothetical protein
MVVEPVHGDLKRACAAMWRTVQQATDVLAPRLERLEVVDDATDQVVTRASVGLAPQIRRKEFWLPLPVGIANGVILAVSGTDAATVRATIPGFAAAGLALAVILVDAVRRTLVWHE